MQIAHRTIVEPGQVPGPTASSSADIRIAACQTPRLGYIAALDTPAGDVLKAIAERIGH